MVSPVQSPSSEGGCLRPQGLCRQGLQARSPLITHRGLFPSPLKMSVFKEKACAFGCLEVRIEEGHYKLEFAKLVNVFCSGAGSSAASES